MDSTARPPRLETRDITSSYEEGGRRLTALDGLSLTVGVGEFVALVGPSGSGKSTLLDIVAGLIMPDSGAVLLDGVVTSAPQRLGHSAYMQQRDLLLPWRTTIGNAGLGLRGRRFVEERYDWEVVLAPLDTLLARVARAGAPAGLRATTT